MRIERKKQKRPLSLVNQKGIAMVEMLPLLAVFIVLFGLTFGFWTSVHNGTLSSIAARHYAFEVLNNRTQFIFHRDYDGSTNKQLNMSPGDYFPQYHNKSMYRFFAVVERQHSKDPKFHSEERRINLFAKPPLDWPSFTRKSDKANPIWVKMGYGICIDCDCGGKNCKSIGGSGCSCN